MPDLILRNGFLYQPGLSQPANPTDLAITNGRITAIGPNLPLTAPQEIDATGQLISPPFVESHIHLDSVLTAGQPRWNQSGTLFEGIQIWGDRKRTLTFADVKDRALQALRLQAQQGTLFVRTHADVSEPTLTALQALLEIRDQVRDWITVQVVAFPQDGLYGATHQNPIQNDALLEEALRLGADVVGGIPHYELTREDGVRSIHRIFELAQQYDRPIDLHCDEIDDEQSRFLEVLAACAYRSGLGPRTTASHTTAFGSYNNAYALKLLGLLQKAQLNFIANPLINITLQGRTDTYPKRRGITRVKELWQAGLNLSLGHDCIQDPWYSLGTGNMLDVARMAIHTCQMTGLDEIDACYAMITQHGAHTLGIADQYGLQVDRPATLILVNAPSPYEALRQNAIVTHVIARGHLLATTQSTRTHWHHPNLHPQT